MNALTTPTWEELRLVTEPFYLGGSDRGYNEEAGLITQSADGADLAAMWREFQAAVRLLNAQRAPLVNFLTFPVTDVTERVMLPTQDDFEESSEYGEPKGIRPGPSAVFGYDFKWYDVAIRYTWRYLAESSGDEIRAINSGALEADVRLQFVRVFRTIFNNVNSLATVNDINVNVYRFYNADGTVPPAYKGTTFLSTHTHYLVSGGATLDSGDLTDIEDHLYHHGYRETLGYRLVLMVNRQEAKKIRTFVAPTDPYTFIPNENTGGGILFPPNGGIIGAPGGRVPGQIGTYGPFLVVEEDFIPAGYVFGFATGGEKNIGNPVGIREHEQASLRGLMLMPGPGRDYPLTDAFYQHGLGTGVRHRGAGVVLQVKASGTYDIPALYA